MSLVILHCKLKAIVFVYLPDAKQGGGMRGSRVYDLHNLVKTAGLVNAVSDDHNTNGRVRMYAF